MAEKYQIYTNQQTVEDVGRLEIKPTEKETARLRNLVARYSEIAQSDDMKTKKRQWTALRDLKPERPMILFETFSVTGFVREDELECEDPYLRNAEKTFLHAIKQYELVQDDIVLENYFQLAWRVIRSDYGVKIVEHHAEDSMGYMSNFRLERRKTLKSCVRAHFMWTGSARLDSSRLWRKYSEISCPYA